MNKGLTMKEIKTFNDMKVKANYPQLEKMIVELQKEMVKRDSKVEGL